MNDDTAVIYLLSDIKTRLNHIVKVMRGVFETVRQNKKIYYNHIYWFRYGRKFFY